MPHGWRHPDIACARITLDGQEVKRRIFRETAWRQAAEIVVHGRPAGTVELGYLEERPFGMKGRFLRRSEANQRDRGAARTGGRAPQAEAALRESESGTGPSSRQLWTASGW